MMKVSCIYIIKSKIKPERFYIGSAKDFKRRNFLHLWDLQRNGHINGRLQNHYNKYGESDFYFEIIEMVPNINDLLTREQFYLDSMKPFFNICLKAGSRLGVKATKKRIVSEVTKQRMSESAKKVVRRRGWSHTPESIEKIRLSNKTRWTPDERKKKSQNILRKRNNSNLKFEFVIE